VTGIHPPEASTALQPDTSPEPAAAPYPPCPYVGERRFQLRECVYRWTAALHQNCTAITVRIRLVPDAGITAGQMATLRTTWATGIVDRWSDRFVCRGPYGESRITVAVQWVTSNPHHTVRVRPGPARSDMTTWDTADTGDTAAHEFGHMIGNPDEYAASECPNRTPVNTGSVMDDNSGPALQRHVDRLCRSSSLTADHFSIGLDLI
jgi:hypothetical protein